MGGPEEKIVGILGGMGPEATVDLLQRIIRLTPAQDDGDHIRCIVDSNPKVPSRIKAIIEGTGEDPGPAMAEMGRRLESWGADFLVIACNTAHHYYGAVQQAVRIPVIHLIELVVQHVADHFPEHRRVGILASPAVAMTGLYAAPCKRRGIVEVWPDADHRERLLEVIKAIKKGATGNDVCDRYQAVCRHVAKQGVGLAIVACTELSALKGETAIPTVDAAEVLAGEIVQVAKFGKAPFDADHCREG